MPKDIEGEFHQIETKREWNRVFQQLQNSSPRSSTSESQKTENHDLNRYANVSPFDHSRIKLHRGSTDYINANLVEVSAADRKYILTQGPLPNTIGHFWLMIWEQKTRAILMLNGLIECGQVKCHQYWPSDQKTELSPFILKKVGLRVTLLSEETKENFTKRKLLLTDLETNDSREILQFHYTDWPDFGIPESPSSFLEFVTEVRSSGYLNLENYGPAVVHCSAGIGRSGTFCLVDSYLILVEKNVAKWNIQEVLLEMRKYRSGLIQTRDQLRFAYRAIIQGTKNLLPHENNGEACLLDNNEELRTKEGTRSEYDPDSGCQPTPPVLPGNLSNNNLTSATELRQRIREEKNRKMKEKIESIKEKLKKSESRLRTRNFLFKVGIFSLGIIATASLVYYMWPSSNELPDRTGTQFEQNFVHLMRDNVSLSEPSISKTNGS